LDLKRKNFCTRVQSNSSRKKVRSSKNAGNPFSKRKRVSLLWLLLIGVILVWLAFQIPMPGFTRLKLTNTETEREIFSAILRHGEPITLTWRNSLFNLDVTETFVAENGRLIQTGVTFADPRGSPPPIVSPEDVDDLYHTGGAFSAQGMRRPFTRIAYRVGEIGEPKMTIGARVIVFKQIVGFGGGIELTTQPIHPLELLSDVTQFHR
jgi:hypothetical protein